jgi:uncharacterized membrane protein YidH (DUF202 family)
MKKRTLLYWALLAIAVITILSGLLQVVLPGLVLSIVSAESNPTSRHFFAIIGMFMVLFGGVLLQALLSPVHHPIIVLWASLQKFGAAVAVGLGVAHHAIFSPLALLIAGFDFVSGLLGFWYWLDIRQLSQGQKYDPLVSKTVLRS